MLFLFTFSKKIFNRSGWNFTWAFVMIMYCKMQDGVPYMHNYGQLWISRHNLCVFEFVSEDHFLTKDIFGIILWLNIFMTKIFYEKIFNKSFRANTFTQMSFWPKNSFAQEVLIDWQNCCRKLRWVHCILVLFFTLCR